MAVTKGISDVSRIIVQGAGDYIEEIADAGRRAYCNLYTNSPSWVFMKDNLIIPVVTRSLNAFCSDFAPPPPPPSPGFTGGQCGINYDIDITFDYFPQFSTEVATQTQNIASLSLGPFSKFRGIIIGQDDVIRTYVTKTGGTEQLLGDTSSAGIGSIVEDSWFWTLTPSDGSPDVCGDPLPLPYPDIPPPILEDASDIVTITNNEGDIYDYSTTINFDPGGTFVFPPVINVGGVSVTIDVGGITIDRSSTNFSGGGGGSGGDTFGNDVEPPPPPEIEEEQEEQEENVENTVEKLIAIVVSLVTIPGDTSVTDGRGAPDIYYAGWIEFKNKGKYYPRQFIHFQESRFQAPDENDGYAVTYAKGFVGIITEITEQETV